MSGVSDATDNRPTFIFSVIRSRMLPHPSFISAFISFPIIFKFISNIFMAFKIIFSFVSSQQAFSLLGEPEKDKEKKRLT